MSPCFCLHQRSFLQLYLQWCISLSDLIVCSLQPIWFFFSLLCSYKHTVCHLGMGAVSPGMSVLTMYADGPSVAWPCSLFWVWGWTGFSSAHQFHQPPNCMEHSLAWSLDQTFLSSMATSSDTVCMYSITRTSWVLIDTCLNYMIYVQLCELLLCLYYYNVNYYYFILYCTYSWFHRFSTFPFCYCICNLFLILCYYILHSKYIFHTHWTCSKLTLSHTHAHRVQLSKETHIHWDHLSSFSANQERLLMQSNMGHRLFLERTCQIDRQAFKKSGVQQVYLRKV